MVSDDEDMTQHPVTLAHEARRYLHQHPGIGFAVDQAGEYIARICTSLGWTVTRGIGGTGVVATMSRGSSPRSIALRADMDGLAITEATGLDYASDNLGAMHACGHDGHMAMLMGTAATLSASPGFDGTVHMFFQPAEEPGTGAEAMIADDLFARFPVEAVYGLHNIPGIPEGEIHVRSGPIMAAEDNFEINIVGRGGHASAPHLVIDPMIIGAELVLALQSIVSRSIDPLHAVVVSCTELVTDGARNAIPSTVTIKGDVRTFTDENSRLVEQRIHEIASGIGSAHRAGATVSYSRVFRPTVNDPDCVAEFAAAAASALGEDRVNADCQPITASEDFAAYAREVPACFGFLGTGIISAEGDGATPLHSSIYDFNDAILEAGIAVFSSLVRSALPDRTPS